MKHGSVFFNAVALILVAALTLGAGLILPGSAMAGPLVRSQANMSIHGHGGGGHGGGHGHGHGGGHNTNVNVNINNNVHINDHHDNHYHEGHYHHDSVGDVVAGVVTGLAIGAIVTAASMPPANTCSDVVVNGIAYRQCGSTWYQPCYQGTVVQYVVVNPPR